MGTSCLRSECNASFTALPADLPPDCRRALAAPPCLQLGASVDAPLVGVNLPPAVLAARCGRPNIFPVLLEAGLPRDAWLVAVVLDSLSTDMLAALLAAGPIAVDRSVLKQWSRGFRWTCPVLALLNLKPPVRSCAG